MQSFYLKTEMKKNEFKDIGILAVCENAVKIGRPPISMCLQYMVMDLIIELPIRCACTVLI